MPSQIVKTIILKLIKLKKDRKKPRISKLFLRPVDQ
ncbi:hypothetical protein Mgra_00004345 [Meloidogyne graminicola]|uniref:Uncharacterized protein n=1 Tax=Meloidogyne graminicola TaxID=189291 RepID=A0A8S9ZRW1_9BILA|nr:hypothetical protein Mgra_00004345 [Meloidogyne graminicola]